MIICYIVSVLNGESGKRRVSLMHTNTPETSNQLHCIRGGGLLPWGAMGRSCWPSHIFI